MSKKTDKQIGDLVRITGGAHSEKEGILQEKVSKGWNIKLHNGEVVLTAFPFIKLLAKAGESAESPQSEEPQDSETIPEVEPEISVAAIIEEANENPSPASEEPGEVTVAISEETTEPSSSAPSDQVADEKENIKKMTTLQLRDLAKQKGVSVARTKDDFFRIIKEKNPDEDLERLKGKILFDRVSELHISRLRSKEDLQKLLVQK